MKKTVALLCAAAILLSLGACKKKTEENTAQAKALHTATVAQENAALHSVADQIVGGVFVGNFNDYSPAEKKIIQQYLANLQYQIEFQADGTAVLTKAGDTWTVTNQWVKNRYTKDLPVPEFGTVSMYMEEKEKTQSSFVVSIKSNGSTKAYQSHTAALEKAGYHAIGGQVYDDDDFFRGINKDDKVIEISVTGKGYIYKITMPNKLP